MDASDQNKIIPFQFSVPGVNAPTTHRVESLNDVVTSLVRLMALKDKATLQHSHRVYDLTQEWATYLRSRWGGLDFELEALEIAALLHDIGKIGILDEVLLKEESLSPSERDHMQQHSEIGYQMIRDYPRISSVAMGIRHHHERWDGKGYPLGLKEKQIPVIAQMICLVDAYDAMTSDRPYKKARSHEEALQEISNEAGRQFSPDLARVFIEFMHARNT